MPRVPFVSIAPDLFTMFRTVLAVAFADLFTMFRSVLTLVFSKPFTMFRSVLAIVRTSPPDMLSPILSPTLASLFSIFRVPLLRSS